ncbi:MAG: phosphoglycerate dehydrogenase [Pseudomonadota bacterium]
MTWRVQCFNRIADRGLDRLRQAGCEVGTDLENPDGIILRSKVLSEALLGDSVLAVARAGAGVNNIPIEICTGKGQVVFNTPGANANAVKELVVAGLMLSSRDILGGAEFVKSLASLPSDQFGTAVEAEKKRFAGREVAGRTLGIVGLGAIGSLVANAALELGMDVVGFDPALSVEAAWRLSSAVEKMESLKSLFAKADYITLHVPDMPATRGMIDAEAVSQMKTGSVVMNFARAGIVDLAAVTNGLQTGQLGCYVTDFPSPELLQQPNAIALPHIGASTEEAEANCARMAADQLATFLATGNVRNAVNFPATEMEVGAGHRITFSNENVPRVLGDVLGLLADADLNVIDLVNRSRGELAYNIIDVETQPSAELVAAIRAVPNVIRVRTLNGVDA